MRHITIPDPIRDHIHDEYGLILPSHVAFRYAIPTSHEIGGMLVRHRDTIAFVRLRNLVTAHFRYYPDLEQLARRMPDALVIGTWHTHCNGAGPSKTDLRVYPHWGDDDVPLFIIIGPTREWWLVTDQCPPPAALRLRPVTVEPPRALL